MHAACLRFLQASLHHSGIYRDLSFRFGARLWMTCYFFPWKIPGVHLFVANSVWNLAACGGTSESISAYRRSHLLLEFSRNEWVRTQVFRGSSWCILSTVSVPFGFKNCCVEQSWGIVSDSLEADRRPDMFSFFAGKMTEVPASGVKDVDKKNDEADRERLKKEEEKRKRDEEDEKLRKEKDLEARIGPPPEKPLPGDCCGNGCTPCVWDTYWEEVADYKKLRQSVEESQ